MAKDKKHNPIFEQTKPWIDNHNDIWLASTISLYRNIENFKFPAKMTAQRRKQVIPLVTKELLASSHLSSPVFIKAEDVLPQEKEYLVEHFLSDHSYQEAYSGEGFVLDQSGQFLATINILDHVHLQIMDVRGELEQAWNKLVKVEMSLGKAFTFAYSSRFGFLASDPTSSGTALSVSVYLQPSALIHTGKIEDMLEKYTDKSIAITGLQGSPTEIIGDVLNIRNNMTLGINEENIISSVRSFATKLLVEESSLRNSIKNEESAEMKDKVSRAFGVLMHSYQIEAIEALNAISLMKLGSELGWLTGVTTAALNELFFNCRRAHLLHNCGEEIKQENIPHKRAEFIHKILKDVSLTI